MPSCYPCNRFFPTMKGLDQHLEYNSAHADEDSDMSEREASNSRFSAERSAGQHVDSLGNFTDRYECESCEKVFSSKSAVENHMHAKRHWEHYCDECKLVFDDANCLRMHLKSRTHLGTTVSCPFCDRPFVTASGVLHHLETGSCPSAPVVDRNTIHQDIQADDPNGVITIKQLGWYSKAEHIKLGPHGDKIYHCPDYDCAAEFASLGGLLNHLESETCGYPEWEKVWRSVRAVLYSSRGYLDF